MVSDKLVPTPQLYGKLPIPQLEDICLMLQEMHCVARQYIYLDTSLRLLLIKCACMLVEGKLKLHTFHYLVHMATMNNFRLI